MNSLIYSSLFLFVFSINADTSFLVEYRDVCEKLDIDALLRNHRLVSIYMKCLLDKKNCNKEGTIIRSAIPEILTTTCANCSEKEKYIVRRAMSFIYKSRNADFEKIYEQFDPENIYRTKIMDFMFDNSTSINTTVQYSNNDFPNDLTV